MCCCPVRLQDFLIIIISLMKQSNSIRDSYHGKITYKATAVGWVWRSMPSHAQTLQNLSRG